MWAKRKKTKTPDSSSPPVGLKKKNSPTKGKPIEIAPLFSAPLISSGRPGGLLLKSASFTSDRIKGMRGHLIKWDNGSKKRRRKKRIIIGFVKKSQMISDYFNQFMKICLLYHRKL
jgi:hypothetical protein